jgi:hypothetical protein
MESLIECDASDNWDGSFMQAHSGMSAVTKTRIIKIVAQLGDLTSKS